MNNKVLYKMQDNYKDWFEGKGDKILFDNSTFGTYHNTMNMFAAAKKCGDDGYVLFVCPPMFHGHFVEDFQAMFPEQSSYRYGKSVSESLEMLASPESHQLINIHRLCKFVKDGGVLSPKFKVMILLHHIHLPFDFKGFLAKKPIYMEVLEEVMPKFEKGIIVSRDTFCYGNPEVNVEYLMGVMGIDGGVQYAIGSLINNELNMDLHRERLNEGS